MVQIPSKMSTTIFHTAAKTNFIRLLQIATTDECDAKDEFGMTPILWAASYGHSVALEVICIRGGNVDDYDYLGNTALHLAVASGYIDCVNTLLRNDANPYSRNLEGQTPQQLAAAMKEREPILDLINKSLECFVRVSAIPLKERAIKHYNKLQKEFTERLAKDSHSYNAEDSTMPKTQ